MFPIESYEFNFIRPFVQFSLLDTLFSSRRRNYYYRPPPYPLSIPRSSEIPHPLESMEKKRSFPKWNRSNSNPPSIRADINFNLSLSPLHDSRIHRVLGILSPRFRRGEIGESSRPEMGFHLGGGMLLVDLCPKEDRGKLSRKHIFVTDIWWNLGTFPLIFQYLISKLDIRIRSNFFSSVSCVIATFSGWWMLERKEKGRGEVYHQM